MLILAQRTKNVFLLRGSLDGLDHFLSHSQDVEMRVMFILVDLYNLVPRFVKNETPYGTRVNKINYNYRRKKRTLKQRNHIHLNIKSWCTANMDIVQSNVSTVVPLSCFSLNNMFIGSKL